MVVTPGKNFIGQKGFPTPSDIPDNTACRIFVVPDNDEWLGLLMGAVELLLNPHNYFNYGALSIDDTTANWGQIVDAAYALSLYSQCSVDVPAPYWDDLSGDDADDMMPAASQIWYGELTVSPALLLVDDISFVENVGIFGIAAFIAYSGQIGAAIAFVPIARRFVLAWHAHDLGGIVRVFIDASEVGRVDTYSPTDTVANLNVFLPDDDDEHTLYVMLSDESNPAVEGAPAMQVIRKRLWEGEVYPTNQRYNADCDCIQTTPDNGTTWNQDDGADPRHNTAYQLPPPAGDDPQCQSAANMVRFLSNVIDETLTAIAITGDVLGLATALLPLFLELGPFAILFDLVLALASTLVSAGATAIDAAFTNDVYDDLTCIFYCNIQTDGSVTPDDLIDIEGKVSSEIGGLVSVVIDAMLFLTGEVGLTNEGAIGDAPADCDSCDCTFHYHFDFQAGNQSAAGWAGVVLGGVTYATYAAGQGWHYNPHNGLILGATLPSSGELTRIAYNGTSFFPGSPTGRSAYWRFGGSTLFTHDDSGISNPYTFDFSHTDTCDEIWLNPYAGVADADIYIIAADIFSNTEIPDWSSFLV